MWAVINSDGTIRAASPGVTGVFGTQCHNTLNAALCGVVFPQVVTNCSVLATPEGNTAAPTDVPLMHTVIAEHPYSGNNHMVSMETFLGTAPTAEAFDINVVC
jgi:hypothetical protein